LSTTLILTTNKNHIVKEIPASNLIVPTTP